MKIININHSKGAFDIIDNGVKIRFQDNFPKYKSKIYIGNSNFIIYHTKHFNWFRKLMYKIAFDIKIEDNRW